MHHTDAAARAARDRPAGRRPAGSRYRVTYHDPCHLGRFNGEYDAPRRILELLGCTLVEMPRNRDNSFCCGAGGGRIWIPDKPGQERPSENRIREAVELPEVELFVVACPKDVTMYEDAIKTSGNAERIELRELTELVEEALVAASRAGDRLTPRTLSGTSCAGGASRCRRAETAPRWRRPCRRRGRRRRAGRR